jgi:hypothetical protein
MSMAMTVAAGVFQGRIYLASRWKAEQTLKTNFSEDGENWSGWRVPETSLDPFFTSVPAGLAASGNHLYIFAPATAQGDNVWVY